MARLVQGFLALSAALLLLLSWLPISLASSKRPAAVTSSADIPIIKCQVCEKVAHQIYRQVKKKESDIAPKELSKDRMSEVAGDVCNLEKEQANWILQIDIVKNGEKSELVEQGVKGQCNSDCKNIVLTCQEVIEHSNTDVGRFLFEKKPSVDSFVNYLCNDLSKACPVPKVEVIQEKDLPKKDLTHRILQGITETPQKVWKWFEGKTTGFESPKASKTEL